MCVVQELGASSDTRAVPMSEEGRKQLISGVEKHVYFPLLCGTSFCPLLFLSLSPSPPIPHLSFSHLLSISRPLSVCHQYFSLSLSHCPFLIFHALSIHGMSAFALFFPSPSLKLSLSVHPPINPHHALSTFPSFLSLSVFKE